MIGQTLNGYLIESQIAVTTSGTIFKAKDVSLEVPRAIKVLHSNLVEKDSIQKRFKLALQAWSKLDHSTFAHIFGAIDSGKTLAFIMEFVDGITLREILNKDGKLAISQAVDYFLQLARALSFAHKHKILHRKLSPENIKICQDQSLKIMGLGALREIDGPRVTPSNLCVGKVKYMAPEQFRGGYSASADQYTIGVILYEMLTGKVPFIAKTIPELYKKHVMEEPVPPQKFNSEIGNDLQNIILKMLAKKPESRFPDLDSIISAIVEASDIVDSSNADVNINSLMYRGRKSLERHKLENAIYFFSKVLAIHGFETPYSKEALEKRNEAFKMYEEEEDIRQIRDLITEALDCFDDEKFEKAQEYVLKILDLMRKYPDSSRVRGLRMDLAHEVPEILADASKDLDQTIAKSKELTKTAEAFVEEAQYKDAIETLSQAIQTDSQNENAQQLKAIAEKKLRIMQITVYCRDGLIAMKNRRYEEAISCFRKVLEIKSEQKIAQKYLHIAEKEITQQKTIRVEIEKFYQDGRDLYERWEYAEAMKRFEYVLKINGNHTGALEYIRLIEDRLKEDNRMEDIGFFYRQAVGFYDQQKWKEAITCFNHVLSVMPVHKKALEYKSLAEQNLKQAESFKSIFKDAVFLFKQNNYSQALEKFNYLMQLDSQNSEVIKYRRLCMEFIGISKQAQKPIITKKN